jgi:CRP/FNR family transcriptional regulator, cyclic AMP receptor protein
VVDGDPKSRAAISLLRVWPDLAASVPEEERAQAERALVVPLIVADGGALSAALDATADAFAFVLAQGIVLKETEAGRRSALEWLTEGDVLAPLPEGAVPEERRGASRYRGLGRVAVGVLEQRFRLVARRWPAVSDCLHTRLAEQVHRASLHLATLHLPRAEDRLVVLFGDLAERLGRVTPEGVLLEIALTHDALGQLIGSRRPTVSLALQELEQAGLLTRRGDAWLLPGGAVDPRRSAKPV